MWHHKATMRKVLLSILALTIVACNSKTGDMGNKTELAPFKVIGISVRTSIERGQSMADMGQLWGRFYADNIRATIPHKISNDVYSIYTDYQTDYTGAYTAIIGCKVNSLDSIPEGLIGREIKGEQYVRYTAKGKMPDAVVSIWQEIWKSDKVLDRKYTADFEVYGQKSQDPENAEVEVYIATK